MSKDLTLNHGGLSTETTRLFQDLTKPNLVALSYALRHPETWPEGFVWNYSECTQCAMGLAHKLWKIPLNRDGGAVNENCSSFGRAFAISFSTAEKIFFGAAAYRGYRRPKYFLGFKTHPGHGPTNKEITPDMVADDIDAYLATAG